MVKITAQVEGMRCGMCEAHVNEVVRRAFPVQKVTSSHARGQTVILAEQDIADEALKKVIRDTGYEVTSIIREPYAQKKRPLFLPPPLNRAKGPAPSRRGALGHRQRGQAVIALRKSAKKDRRRFCRGDPCV